MPSLRFQFVLALVVSAVLLFSTPAAHADAFGKNIGLGPELGSPTGVAMKWFFNGPHSLEAAAGVGFWDKAAFHVHGDYVYSLRVVSNKELDMDLTPGVGPFIQFHEAGKKHGPVDLGFRVPFGLDFMVKHFAAQGAPIDFFFQIAPGARFVGGVGFYMDGGIGGRYYF